MVLFGGMRGATVMSICFRMRVAFLYCRYAFIFLFASGRWAEGATRGQRGCIPVFIGGMRPAQEWRLDVHTR